MTITLRSDIPVSFKAQLEAGLKEENKQFSQERKSPVKVLFVHEKAIGLDVLQDKQAAGLDTLRESGWRPLLAAFAGNVFGQNNPDHIPVNYFSYIDRIMSNVYRADGDTQVLSLDKVNGFAQGLDWEIVHTLDALSHTPVPSVEFTPTPTPVLSRSSSAETITFEP